MKKHSLWVILLLPIFVLSAGPALADDPVSICDDESKWPPYSFYQRLAGETNTDKVEGATVDLVAKIFERINLEYSYDIVAWKRCLFEVANFGERKNYEVVVNASYNEKRSADYYVTAPIYSTRFGVAYAKHSYPNGVTIGSLKDLKNYKLCGPTGYNFSMYQLEYDEVDTRSRRYEEVLKRVAMERCQLGLIGIEIIQGLSRIEGWDIPEDLVLQPLWQVKPTSFHIWVSRQSPRALELTVAINQAIVDLQHNGVSDRIFAKYLGPIGTR